MLTNLATLRSILGGSKKFLNVIEIHRWYSLKILVNVDRAHLVFITIGLNLKEANTPNRIWKEYCYSKFAQNLSRFPTVPSLERQELSIQNPSNPYHKTTEI